MTPDQIKEKGQVSKAFISELKQLIELAGYNRTEESLRAFAWLGGGAKAGISHEKINWVLDSGWIPKMDFLFALANIAIKVRGKDYYKGKEKTPPLKYEYERYLKMCNYTFGPGSIWPIDSTCRRLNDLEAESYLNFVPNLFWDLSFDFTDVVNHFYQHRKYSEQSLALDEQTTVTFGLYNYDQKSDYQKTTPIDMKNEPASTPDILRFKLDNTNEELRFKSIEIVRSARVVNILIVLINGHWLELTNSRLDEVRWPDWQTLETDNFYNALDLFGTDPFFWQISKAMRNEPEFKNAFNIERLYSKLGVHPGYEETYQQLTLKKKT